MSDLDMDCGDNSCRFATDKTGMRTNGGCRCIENPSNRAKILRKIQLLERKVVELETQEFERTLEHTKRIVKKDINMCRLAIQKRDRIIKKLKEQRDGLVYFDDNIYYLTIADFNKEIEDLK